MESLWANDRSFTSWFTRVIKVLQCFKESKEKETKNGKRRVRWNTKYVSHFFVFHRTLLFSFFVFFSFDSLKHWRTFNTHVNQQVKLLLPPILENSTRFSLYDITEVSRKPKHTHFKSSLQKYTFYARFSSDQCHSCRSEPFGWGPVIGYQSNHQEHFHHSRVTPYRFNSSG